MKYLYKLRTVALTSVITIVSLLTGCEKQYEPISVSDFKLNTYVSITAYDTAVSSILQGCLNLCDTYENMFSRTKETSLLSQVNRHELTQIPAELAELIQYGVTYSELSNGAFDLTIGSVSSLWDFTADNPIVPDNSLIDEGLSHVDYRKVSLVKNPNDDTYTIDIPEGMVLDLGAIAKGYIADRLKDYLLENGVKRAVINLGGNVLCVGSKTSSSNFTIGIKKPFTESETLATLSISDKSIVSSGTYERYFIADDIFYHHILNPSTGFPYDNGLVDVTIISDQSIQGDCLSTTCFTLGLDNGMALIESLDNVEAIFVTDDGSIHYSSGADKYMVK